MSSRAEIWRCPVCGYQVDIAKLGFYTELSCPQCEHTEMVHTIVSSYRVEGVLGVGGMSVVLRARDLVLNRCVAIKLLNETYRNQPERIERFENECAMMAKVRHENVVSVYAAGRARRQFYIAMELVNGQDLDTCVAERGPLPAELAIEYTIQAAHGLAAAHKAGLLHRDMKPGNVIITEDGRAKVLDFGLALAQSDIDSEETIWATPYYAAPETLERQTEDVRTDIYALGMTLRFLLSGIGQFEQQVNTVSQLLEYKQALQPLTDIVPGIYRSLSDLVQRMTAYERHRRPASYRDLLAELRAVQVALVTGQNPEAKREYRRKLRMGVFGTLAAGACVAVAAAYIVAPPPAREYLRLPEEDSISASASLLNDAEQALSAKDFRTAYTCFSALSSGAVEPTLAAWSALHAAILADVLNDSDGATVARAQYLNHISRDDASPAGSRVMAQLMLVSDAEDREVTSEFIPDPCVRALYLVSAGRSMYADGRTVDAAAKFRRAATAFREAPEPYKALADDVESLARNTAATAISASEENARKALRRHDIAAAREGFRKLLGLSELSDDKKEELQVLLEVCELAEAAIGMLQRRCGDDYQAGISAEAVRKMVAALGKEKLSLEMASLIQLINGDYNAAFAINPYRSTPESPEPFAVIMRDWQQRLKR